MRGWVTMAVLLLLTVSGGPVRAADKQGADVLDVNGRHWSGRVSALSDTAITLNGDTPAELETSNLLWLKFIGRKIRPLAGRAVLFLANGDRLVADPAGMDDEAVHVHWSLRAADDSSKSTPTDPAPQMAVPTETIRGILFSVPGTHIARNNIVHALLNRDAKSDAVFLDNGDRLTGELLQVDRETLSLKGPVGKTSLRRTDVRAVGFNPDLISFPAAGGWRAIVEFTDGSRLTVTRIQLAGNRLLTFETRFGASATVPLTAVASMRFLGGRAVYLSDLKPSAYRFTPFLTVMHTLHRDRNVLGDPLRLRGHEYPKGLGMFSRTTVTYQLNGRFRAFQSIVGIDDSTGGDGNAVFAVEVDGRRVFTSGSLGGKSPAKQVGPIPLSGAKQLTLIVDYGERGDIQDRADWCDAVLIKKP